MVSKYTNVKAINKMFFREVQSMAVGMRGVVLQTNAGPIVQLTKVFLSIRLFCA